MARETELLGTDLDQLQDTLAHANTLIAKLLDDGVRVEIIVDHFNEIGGQTGIELAVAAYRKL